MTRRTLVILVSVACAIGWDARPSAQPPASSAAGRPLVFLTDRDYPPLSYVEDGVVTGIDVDITRSIARVLGREIRIEAMDWATAQQQVLRGEADGLLSISITQERRALYDFSTPIVSHDFGLFIRAGDSKIRTVTDVSGRKVGVTAAGLPRRLLEASSTAVVIPLNTYEEAFTKLANGELDAVAADVWVGAFIVEHLGVRNIVRAGAPFASLDGAIGVAKGNHELLDQIDRALAKLRADGTIDAILKRWRPTEVVFVTRGRMDWIVTSVIVAFVVLLLIGVHAIRQRMRAQGRHRHAEARARLLAQALECASDGILITDTNERVLYANAAFRRANEFDDHELVGQHVSIVRAAVEPPELAHEIHRATFEGDGWRGIIRSRTKTGRVFPVSLATSVVKDEHGKVIAAVGVARDRTAEEQAEAARRASEQKYRQVVDNARDIIFSIDRDGYCTSMNLAGRIASGFTGDTPRGIHVAHLVAPEHAGTAAFHLARVLTGETVPRFEVEILSRDGKRLTLELDVHAIRVGEEIVGAQGIARDITARKSLEAQLLQAQKMEAVGRLAGGIAHDFNNVLTVIIACAELVGMQVDASHPVQGDVQQILQAAASAAALTRQLLIFSRKSAVVLKVVALNDSIGALEKMLRRLVGVDIDVVLRLASNAGHVEVDLTQLDQVVMNLVVNARDAMPHGGHLTLETGAAVVDDAFATAHGVKAGEFATLTVTDSGVGMTPAVQAQIFDPFFTTKGPSKGTGLGLATVDGIVRQTGGCVTVESAPGRGTSFTVYLPKVVPAPETAREIQPPPARYGAGTILLVDNDETVRFVAARALAARGYKVVTARDAAEALLLARARRGAFDLLLTDVMQGDDWYEIVAEIRAHDPGVRVLFTSGYIDDRIALRGVEAEGAALLQKPYDVEVLVSMIAEILASPSTSPPKPSP